MTKKNELYVTFGTVMKYISHIDPHAEIDFDQGQVVVDGDGMFVSARLPREDRIPAELITELEAYASRCAVWPMPNLPRHHVMSN